YCPNLIALALQWADKHSEIGLTARAGECGGEVSLRAGGILKLQDEHMLRHPPLVPGHDACYPQGEALLAQERIAAVAGAIAPNEALFREVKDEPPLGAHISHRV